MGTWCPPVNDGELLYTLVSELLAAICFGYLLSTVADLMKNVDPNAVLVQEKVDEVKTFLRWHKFPPELTTRVKRYIEFYYSRKSAMDEEDIMGLLAPTLRRHVQTHLMKRSTSRIPLFGEERGYCTLNLQLAIHASLKPVIRDAREIIMESLCKGSAPGPSIFFIRRGAAHATTCLPGISSFYEIDTRHPDQVGAILGEHSLCRNSQCICTYRALTRCELFALSVEDLFHIMRAAEADVDEMAGLVLERLLGRLTLRAYTILLAARGASTELAHAGVKGLRSVLKLQGFWLLYKSRELRKESMSEDAHLPSLVPALFTPPTKLRVSVLNLGEKGLKERSFKKATVAPPTLWKNPSFAKANSNISSTVLKQASPTVTYRVSEASNGRHSPVEMAADKLNGAIDSAIEKLEADLGSKLVEKVNDAIGRAFAKLESELESKIDLLSSDIQAVHLSVAEMNQKTSHMEQASEVIEV